MRALLTLGVLGLVLAGCAGTGPGPGPARGSGDPGNQRLDQLAADRVFAALPPGAVASGPLERTPARYRAPAFQPAGWDGPAASLTFTSPRPPASVYAYFQDSAAAAGWRPVNVNALGYPQTWTKTYPDGVRGDLSLTRRRSNSASAGEAGAITYVLNASSPAA